MCIGKQSPGSLVLGCWLITMASFTTHTAGEASSLFPHRDHTTPPPGGSRPGRAHSFRPLLRPANGSSCLRIHPEAQLPELRRLYGRGRVGHQALGPLRLGERDDVPQGIAACKEQRAQCLMTEDRKSTRLNSSHVK